MFNLEQSIAEWRKRMLAAGIKTLALDELESHLREEIERQIKLGLGRQQAFEFAVRQIGPAKQIKSEFTKLESWNPPLAWMAWGIFVVSFFLPAADGFLSDSMKGWQCAWASATILSWDAADFWHGSWPAIHMQLLALSNLVMVASPFLLMYFRLWRLKWSRLLFLGAAILVWSYIGIEIINGNAHYLKIGCYAWGLSFLLLCLSTCAIRNPKTLLAKYV